MPEIIINDDIIDNIMSEFAFPIIDFEDFPYTKEVVKNRFIWQAMRKYYIHFPIKSYDEISASGEFSVDFPRDTVFNIVDARLNTNDISSGANTYINDPLVRSRNVSVMGTLSSGRYGTPYSYGNERTYHSKRAEYQAIKNSQNAFRIKVDTGNRKVYGYNNIQGKVSITWAEYSINFGDIPFEKIADVEALAKAYIFRAWGNMILMTNTDLGNDLDGGFLKDRSDELEEQIIDRWNKLTKVAIIRSR